MSDFGPTDERLRRVATRMPGFALEPMRLVRMSYQLQKGLRDTTNAVLKKYDLVDTSYTVLAILYGSADETSTATELSEACHEKPANLTRVCDELVARDLIRRSPKPGDRRAVMISLSERGRALVEQALPEVSAKLAAIYADFPASDLERMGVLSLQLLGRLNDQA
ncbi:MarR family transcriptional regulator [Massilia sp. WF1]|uniref:MarR family transcriptional regulator n=1 Tax=unclassified Massilia TaxID=2609279 RepID=UPI00068CB634|nr:MULTISPECIES: MarR family transcriptional regulator [unclassified Massilia]ALK97625.1 MarR family transcriptional regulator [Massilia sp. WG5]KNZ67795.1 MarR family transcriptional regulator [Massilia sp. WF1]